MGKRNPQDTTLRNLRALKAKHLVLKARVKRLEDRVKVLVHFVRKLK